MKNRWNIIQIQALELSKLSLNKWIQIRFLILGTCSSAIAMAYARLYLWRSMPLLEHALNPAIESRMYATSPCLNTHIPATTAMRMAASTTQTRPPPSRMWCSCYVSPLCDRDIWCATCTWHQQNKKVLNWCLFSGFRPWNSPESLGKQTKHANYSKSPANLLES